MTLKQFKAGNFRCNAMKPLRMLFCSLLLAMHLNAQTLPKNWVKDTEKSFVSIPGTQLYASVTECSVAQYQLFLAASEFNKKQYIYDSAGWGNGKFFPAETYYITPLSKVYYNHPAYQSYPVVNITKAAAMAYCEWLTQTYNAQPNRKYKKVEFRLPRADEYTRAAMGKVPEPGIKKIFPWNGLYPRNAKGIYLANYAPSTEMEMKRNASGELVVDGNMHFTGNLGADGSMLIAAPKAYPPNDFGLYHIVGNVSEFVLETGKAMGGSYVSPLYYLQIQVTEPEFPGLDQGACFVGFRPYMVIVEP